MKTKRRGKLADSFGKWKMSDEEYEKIKKELKNSWASFGNDLLRSQKRLSKNKRPES